jgi:excisionase family DNA binding protein
MIQRKIRRGCETSSVREVATRLGVGCNFIYDAVKSGSLPAIKAGRCIRVPRRAVDDLLANGGEIAAAEYE